MPDLLAPYRQGVSSLQRRHSLRNVGGCMGAFSQIFTLSKMLGGSNKFLATRDAPAQSLGTKSRCPAVEKRSAMKAERTQEAEIAIDLRKILDAKQEPFVLQEVIWEKRHPIRSKSSRELKFEMNEVVPSSRKLRSSKRAKSRDDKKNEDVSFNGDLSALSERSEEGSSALVKSNHIPAESMVAMPSSQASPQRRKTRSSSSKMASTGKSPNKRALLMEAASKILEGSNRRASQIPSSSARSLLRELEGSKRAQELLKCKEAPLEEGPLGGDYTNKQRIPLQKVPTLHADSKQHSCCNVGTRFVNQMQQVSPKDSSEMSDEEVLLIMQIRLFPSDEIPAAARGDSSELAMVADKSDAPQLANYVKGLNSDFSIADKTQEETLITLVDVSMEGLEGSANEQTHQQVESIMVSTNIERHHMPPLDRGALVEKNEDPELETCRDSSNINLITEWPMQEVFHSLEGSTPPNHHHAEELHDFSISGEMPDEDCVDCGVDAARSGSCEPAIEEINAYTLPSPIANELVELCRSTGDKPCISVEEIRCEEVETAENVPTPLLRLCNYSWWTEEEMQAYPSTPSKNEKSNDFAGYGSPIAATKGPFAIKVSEEWKEGENLLEDDSTSPDHSYVEEFQQSSPVSVLDAVYDDGPVLSKPFDDYFDEARQKLLESLRRYEMLAHMDLDMLIKINEESLCDESEEESGASSFEESWESDRADVRATQHKVSFMGSPDYESSRYGGGLPNVDAEDLAYDSLYEAVEDDFYTHSNEDLYMQQLQALADKHVVSTSDLIKDVRARFKAERDSRRCKALLDCTSDPSDLDASRGPHRKLRSNSSRSTLEAVEKLTGSVIINAMLHMDLTTSSWSSFHEEVGVMEMEIESSLLAALMQELLSDLVY